MPPNLVIKVVPRSFKAKSFVTFTNTGTVYDLNLNDLPVYVDSNDSFHFS